MSSMGDLCKVCSRPISLKGMAVTAVGFTAATVASGAMTMLLLALSVSCWEYVTAGVMADHRHRKRRL